MEVKAGSNFDRVICPLNSLQVSSSKGDISVCNIYSARILLAIFLRSRQTEKQNDQVKKLLK